MFEFHGDRKRYFEIQVENTRKYVIPFIEGYKKITAGTRVLEIGCGEAGVLKAFTDLGCIGVGVELDEPRLVMAREWMKEELEQNKIFFLSKDVYKVNVEEEFKGKFDIVILKDVIEHIHDQPKLIAWMKSFLNADGVIFFGFPPWQMPFGGHQQVMRGRFLSKLPYYHLLPMGIYKTILKAGKENVQEMVEIKETGISIERFEKIVAQTGYAVVNKTHYLINPIYEYKFGWKPKVQSRWMSKIKYIRNYFTTCVYYLITPNKWHKNKSMIHIVFNEPDIKVLQQAIELDESLQGEVIQIKDDYAVGPLNNIYIGEGIEERKQWWQQVLAGGDYERKITDGEVDDYKTAAELVGTMRRNEEEIIWIWAAQNKHDVSGYYWLLKYMQEFQGRVFILYLNNLPFINEKGNIFYPNWISEIPAKEFLKAKKLAREITLSEFEVDPDEWTRLCNENRGVRLLEGGKKLTQADYDFYDAELKKQVTGDWQKASKIIHHFLSKAKHTTGDAYLLWRLKTMVAQKFFDVQGKIANMKDFEVKTPSAP